MPYSGGRTAREWLYFFGSGTRARPLAERVASLGQWIPFSPQSTLLGWRAFLGDDSFVSERTLLK
jgi:hypothetical protein